MTKTSLVGSQHIASQERLPTPSPGALVIGGDYRGLGIVRSLGRKGIPVWVLRAEQAMGAVSRYALRSLPWPDGDENGQASYLLDLASRHQLDGWAVFPTGDETTALVGRKYDMLASRYRLTTPRWEVMRWGHNKKLTYQLASELGVPCPRTWYPASRQEVAELDCPFPVILKPASKEGTNSFTRAKAWKVENRAELLDRYSEACTLVDPSVIMVQEMIPGGGEAQYSYAALCREGRPIASITARRIRQYPMEFGRYSSYVESISLPEIEEPSRRLLGGMGITGLAEVEFKLDRSDGRYKLLDINPRIWGWHSLGHKAGVDFPYLQWQMVNGERVEESHARPGVRWMRFFSDLPAAVSEIRAGRLSLSDHLKRLSGPVEGAIFAQDDPLPALLELPLVGLFALKTKLK